MPGFSSRSLSPSAEAVVKAATDPAAFIRTNTALKSTSLVPEIRLYLADTALALWQLTEDELEAIGLPPPYWAFAWAGGQALARYILDHPETVRGKIILDFASGSGLVAIACALAGADRVHATEIDDFALEAISLNAQANGVADRIFPAKTDVLAEGADQGEALRVDLLTAGDVCYEKPMADRVIDYLRRQSRIAGRQVLLGDPGRTYMPKSGLTHRAEYRVPVPLDLEDSDLRRTIVWQVEPSES
jgi:predicted nicotinamide N-methyase